MSAAICPNCGRPVETHAMFNPPRCPVIRLRFIEDATDASEGIVSYSAATITYRCADCGKPVTVAHASAWPHECPHCKTAPPTLIVKVPMADRADSAATPRYYEAIIKVNPTADPAIRARDISEGIGYACALLMDEYGWKADAIAQALERVTDDLYDQEAQRNG